MDETGAELPSVNNTEVVTPQPKEGFFSRLRRVFGKSPQTPPQPQPVSNVATPRITDENFNTYSKLDPHPEDKVIRAQQEALGNQPQQPEQPPYIGPSPDDLPLTLPQPGESQAEPETQPTAIPVAPQEEPAEQPKAA